MKQNQGSHPYKGMGKRKSLLNEKSALVRWDDFFFPDFPAKCFWWGKVKVNHHGNTMLPSKHKRQYQAFGTGMLEGLYIE